jgi:Tfp pilus assembly protein PilV
MMRTFSARLCARGRSLTGVLARGGARARGALRAGGESLAPERGDTLIEVIISALLVGLIVVGTLSGFSDVDRVSADQRNHNEATVLANESQEQLRSDPADTFDTSENNFEHTYTKTVNGTTFTISQKASFLNETGTSTVCNATESKRQESNSLRITSSVTWPQLKKRLPVTESSTVTPPTGSALEVDIGNYPTPTAGIPGVKTNITFTPVETTSTDTEEGTTGTTGCFVFGAIPATSAIVEIVEKPGLVDVSGATKFPTKEATIAPNYTTHYPVTLNEGGAITAEFSYEGKAEHERWNNPETEKTKEPVTSNTFVVYNQATELTPFYEVGSTEGEFTSGVWTVKTEPSSGVSTYAHAITTPKEAIKYTNGNLFPFPEPKAWTVYAGACTANNPNELNSTITDPTGLVKPAQTTIVEKVPTAYMKLNVYTGSKVEANKIDETVAYPVAITDAACKSNIAPDNESKINEPESEQKTTIGTASITKSYGGHLEHPFLPLGAGEICLAYNTGSGGSAKHYTYTFKYTLTAGEEYTRNILLGETKEYTESVKREPSKTTESATVVVIKHNSTAEC